ncbi:unnamed protein product [Durusdinium trenchii]|uniref:Pentatricopeptide repeat-containing protein, chloroplastic n=1 Tax=Durusdinium trenchii TaxID=1381693 RepID=A0ABP0P5H6_9DINO
MAPCGARARGRSLCSTAQCGHSTMRCLPPCCGGHSGKRLSRSWARCPRIRSGPTWCPTIVPAARVRRRAAGSSRGSCSERWRRKRFGQMPRALAPVRAQPRRVIGGRWPCNCLGSRSGSKCGWDSTWPLRSSAAVGMLEGGNIPYLFSISCNAQVLHPIATSFAPWSPPWARRSAGALRWPRWRPNWARMSTLSSAQQWQQALEQLLRPEAASPRVVPAPLVTSFLRGMGLASQWLLALVIFHQLRVPLRTRPDTPTMNAAMGCAAAGQAWKVALAILKDMKKQDSTKPNVASFNAAVLAAAVASQWQVALAMLPAMRDHHLQPDTVTFNTLIHALERAGEWRRCLLLLNCSMGLEARNTAASACGKSTEWQRSLALLPGGGPTEVSVNVCMNACLHGSKWAMALQLPGRSLFALHDRLGALERGGAWRGAAAGAVSLRRAARTALLRAERLEGQPMVTALRGLPALGAQVQPS